MKYSPSKCHLGLIFITEIMNSLKMINMTVQDYVHTHIHVPEMFLLINFQVYYISMIKK